MKKCPECHKRLIKSEIWAHTYVCQTCHQPYQLDDDKLVEGNGVEIKD